MTMWLVVVNIVVVLYVLGSYSVRLVWSADVTNTTDDYKTGKVDKTLCAAPQMASYLLFWT